MALAKNEHIIPFSQCLYPQQTEFEIENPNICYDGHPRAYKLLFLNMTPDYYSRAASYNELDAEGNEIVREHSIRLEVEYKQKQEKQIEITPHNVTNIAELLKFINESFVNLKADSQAYSPIYVDWVTHYGLKFDRYEEAAQFGTLYVNTDELDENDEYVNIYDPLLHKVTVPAHLPDFNPYAFPNHPDILENCRIRFWFAPNARILFQNDSILKALGFNMDQYGTKRFNNRFGMNNYEVDKVWYVFSERNCPSYDVTIASRMYSTIQLTSMYHHFKMKLTENEMHSAKLFAAKFEAMLKRIRTETNIWFTVFPMIFTKQIEFQFPNDTNVKHIHLQFSSEINRRLGFPAMAIVTPQDNTKSAPILDIQMQISDIISKSNIIAKDTGACYITCETSPSLVGRGHLNTIVGYCIPVEGTLVLQKNYVPEITFPQYEKTIKFKIYRLGENGEYLELKWPIYCYVEGALVGRPI